MYIERDKEKLFLKVGWKCLSRLSKVEISLNCDNEV